MSLEELGLTPGQVSLFLVNFLLGVAALGLKMSGYLNKIAGLTIFWLSVAGMVAVLLWWRWPLSGLEVGVGLGIAAAAAILTEVIRWKRQPRWQGAEGLVPLVGPAPAAWTPWREADTVLRRYGELEVDFTRHDSGVYRLDEAWDTSFDRFSEAIDRLELAAERAASPQHRDEYLDLCQELRRVLSEPVPTPRGRGYYLALRRTDLIERLRQLVARDKDNAL